ncbi:DMT family transporter [Lacticaseibacillus absianus]|uniref:DMT family transporter n=1 Tax=Lacticaseibacillus absianus TaxID=2729623 RepID=UPI0015CB14A4|nr:EamA family transporter [Lacticaseibacillus absianus]
MRHTRLMGLALAILGSSLWGIAGPASEVLFAQGVSVSWLISSKMLIAGLVTLGYALIREGRAVLAPWRTRADAGRLLIFILFGMIAMQYVYFKAVEVANAPTATILQYLSPVVVLVILAVTTRTLPRRTDVAIIALAMFGTLMVVTRGHLTQLAITPTALFWGLLAALAAALYTLLPAGLLERYSPLTISAWAQLVGGLIVSVRAPVWRGVPQLNALGWANYTFVVLGGTIVAYMVYLASLQYITATAASLLDAFEPLAATLTAVLFMSFHLSLAEVIGGAIIIATVFLMAMTSPKAPR